MKKKSYSFIYSFLLGAFLNIFGIFGIFRFKTNNQKRLFVLDWILGFAVNCFLITTAILIYFFIKDITTESFKIVDIITPK